MDFLSILPGESGALGSSSESELNPLQSSFSVKTFLNFGTDGHEEKGSYMCLHKSQGQQLSI